MLRCLLVAACVLSACAVLSSANPAPSLDVLAAGRYNDSDVAALRAHPHVDFPDLAHAALAPAELTDASCYASFCDNPELAAHDRKQCVTLVLYPSQLSGGEAQWFAVIKAVEKEKGTKQQHFVWINGDSQSEFLAANFGLHASAQPQLLLIDGLRRSYVPFALAITAVQVGAWIDFVSQNHVAYTRFGSLDPVSSAFTEMTKDTIRCPSVERAYVSGAPRVDRNAAPLVLTDEGQVAYIDSEADFDRFVSPSKQPWVLLFCTDAAQECKGFLSAFLNSARVSRNHVRFGLVDTAVAHDLARLYDVHSLPSVRYWDQHVGSKSLATVKTYTGATAGSMAESALVTHAGGLVDANLVKQVFSHSFSDWLATSDPAGATADRFVLRVLLFHYSPEMPAYIQALSYKWRHVIYFGVTIHTESALVKRFGVTQIPSMFFFTVPRVLNAAEKAEGVQVKFDAVNYHGVLSFNHLDKFCEEMYQRAQAKEQPAANKQAAPTPVAAPSKPASVPTPAASAPAVTAPTSDSPPTKSKPTATNSRDATRAAARHDEL